LDKCWVAGKGLCEEKAIKIYTRTGDFGKTSLFSGERVNKSHDRIEACGEVDELNAFLGLLVASLPEGYEGIAAEIQTVQSTLFHVGAWLSTTPGSPLLRSLKEIGEEDVRALEHAIDRMEETLSPVMAFILPGGHPVAAMIHAARTVCRRAERFGMSPYWWTGSSLAHWSMGKPFPSRKSLNQDFMSESE
jgi:cob(I)alamin adenosyltransferase